MLLNLKRLSLKFLFPFSRIKNIQLTNEGLNNLFQPFTSWPFKDSFKMVANMRHFNIEQFYKFIYGLEKVQNYPHSKSQTIIISS